MVLAKAPPEPPAAPLTSQEVLSVTKTRGLVSSLDRAVRNITTRDTGSRTELRNYAPGAIHGVLQNLGFVG